MTVSLSGSMFRHVGLALLVLTGACVPGGRPLPVPIPRTGENLPTRETLIEIGRKQSYDQNPGASDRAELADGIEVTIEPQEGTFRQSRQRLAQGAVVAEFRNNSRKALAEYALEPGGRSFWVVYQKGGEWYSAYIADSKNRELDRYDLRTIIHPPTRPWRQSIAQWQLSSVLMETRPGGSEVMATKVLPWTTCLELGCCKVWN